MGEVVRAEMAANVAEVDVKLGDRVEVGACLVLIESMRMEIPVLCEATGLCEAAGTVSEVHVTPGGVIQEGDVIVVVV